MLRTSRYIKTKTQYYILRKATFVTAKPIKEGWEAVIGIEVHAQINTKTKLFSDTPTSFNEPVNSNVSIIDAAFPGVQPRLNQHAVQLALKTALALKSNIQTRSTFDRKHYFYPDLPQGYQITQQREPIARGGIIRLTELDGLDKSIDVGIHQLQLEQDTGKSIHDMRPGYTLLDLNRAGTGLMEIVTKPDLRSSFQAGLLVKKLQAILRCVGSSKANMEEGSMRCDINVSVHKMGEPFGTRCELKNLNSVRFLSMAIDAEIDRQIHILESGGIIQAETRGFDAIANKTFKLRGKESAPDYRYMPEPDLPPLYLDQYTIDQARSSLPELPDQCRNRIMEQYNMALNDANVLLNEPGSLDFFEKVSQGRNSKTTLNWTLHELFGQLAGENISFENNPISTQQLGSLIDLVTDGTITGPTGKNVLKIMVQNKSKLMPKEIVQEKGWLRIGDEDSLKTLCETLIAKNPEKANTIKQGDPKLFKWFIGQVMKDTKGMADPVALNQVLSNALGCRLEDIEKNQGTSTKKLKKSKKTK
ncbi:B subunit of glutamyl-tRNA amidotransferase [Halteromyces radiatus]|uniref:B subunit of glutamyl-tRNA amidotransferase n=1 Tax=Halteromyces radiatus TaxID=101107 RepID=UPI00222069B9|nr:B subunit of glutamyl-tRNA amidotransferase [Halteromyces radiatus]KAI8085068.1 B subunit of glutamyl-tRNA amidotransferase [Halteromyces radiatus]